jgi:hypothetical protein
MKHLILVFLILPTILLSQTERDQKLKFKPNSGTSTQTSESSSKIVTLDKYHSQKKQTFNNSSTFNVVRGYDYETSNWLRWGAPSYGFNDFVPTYYYDRFGLRQPARIYNINGKEQTIKGQKTHWRLGLSYNTKNQLGGWITIGNKNFFIAEYSSYVPNDRSSFLPNITMSDVIPWNDKQLDDILYGGSVYVGAGTKIGIVGIYVMPGYEWERSNFQFFDELFILSNNGNYSFPNYSDNYFSGKAGLIADYKMGSFRVDYNPFKNFMTFGLGIVF